MIMKVLNNLLTYEGCDGKMSSPIIPISQVVISRYETRAYSPYIPTIAKPI